MTFKGEIKYLAHISQDDPKEFYNAIKQQIEEKVCDLLVEIQYQSTMQLDGRALFSAVIIGRSRSND